MTSVRYKSTGITHVGRVRSHNEDAFLDRPDVGLWAVADGMGGHHAGDVASQTVIQSLDRIQSHDHPRTFLTAVRENLIYANEDLLCAAERDGAGDVIATTVVVLLINGSHFACIWAGDSRLYRYRQNALEQVSRDHSEVQELVERGIISPEDAEFHPSNNVVTRAIGVADELELEMIQGKLEPGDLFLLCSDGLTKEVPDTEIHKILQSGKQDGLAQVLVDHALAAGGRDNVTVVAVSIQS